MKGQCLQILHLSVVTGNLSLNWHYVSLLHERTKCLPNFFKF